MYGINITQLQRHINGPHISSQHQFFNSKLPLTLCPPCTLILCRYFLKTLYAHLVLPTHIICSTHLLHLIQTPFTICGEEWKMWNSLNVPSSTLLLYVPFTHSPGKVCASVYLILSRWVVCEIWCMFIDSDTVSVGCNWILPMRSSHLIYE
jgi:hypothetical protein